MDPTALPYIDALFKEYLLFRGFSDTLQAFGADLRSDKVEIICNLLFRRIVPSLQCTNLMDLLQELDHHVYCRMDRQFEEAIGRMEVALVRLFLVTAIQAHKPEKVKELFELYGELLLSAKDGATWHVWFTLPYVTKPESDPRFQVFFSPQWASLVETSFRNFLTQAFEQLPLPAVLRYDADRAKRAELQRSLDAVKRENAELRARLGLPLPANASAAPSEAARPATLISNGGSSGSGAVAAVSAALATDLASNRPGKAITGIGLQQGPSSQLPMAWAPLSPQQLPLSPYQQQSQQPQAASPTVLQQQQPQRVGSGPQLLLQGHPSGAGEQMPLNVRSTASLASQDTWSSTGTPSVADHSPHGVAVGEGGDSPGVLGGLEEGAVPVKDDGSVQQQQQQQDVQHGRRVNLEEWRREEGRACSAQQNQSQHSGSAVAAAGVGWGAVGGSRSDSRSERRPSSPRGVLKQREVLSGGHTAAITCCAFAPQGTHVASASSDGVVRIWAPDSLASTSGSRGDGITRDGRSSGSGGRSSSGGGEGAGASARCGVFSCGGAVTRLAWDKRGDKLMLVGMRGRGIKAWHLDTKRVVFQVDPEVDAPLVTDLACSPSDPTFACAASDLSLTSGRLSLWNMRAFKKMHTFGIPSSCAITSICFSPDGHRLAAAGIDGKVRLFDPSNRHQVMAWPAADPGVSFSACFLGSSKLLATLCADGYIKLWSTSVVRGPLAGLHLPLCSSREASLDGSGSVGNPAGHVGAAVAGQLLHAGSSSGLRRGIAGMWQAGGLQWRPEVVSNAAGSAFAASSVTAEVPVVCVHGGDELRLETGWPGHSAAVSALDWHPDGDVLLTGSVDRSLILSDIHKRDVTG